MRTFPQKQKWRLERILGKCWSCINTAPCLKCQCVIGPFEKKPLWSTQRKDFLSLTQVSIILSREKPQKKALHPWVKEHIAGLGWWWSEEQISMYPEKYIRIFNSIHVWSLACLYLSILICLCLTVIIFASVCTTLTSADGKSKQLRWGISSVRGCSLQEKTSSLLPPDFWADLWAITNILPKKHFGKQIKFVETISHPLGKRAIGHNVIGVGSQSSGLCTTSRLVWKYWQKSYKNKNWSQISLNAIRKDRRWN